jgi:hypothetical protein
VHFPLDPGYGNNRSLHQADDMIRLAWEKGLRTLNFGTVEISMRSGRKTRKTSSRRDKEHCGKGTSRRIMSLKLKYNVAVLNIGVTNHIFDSLKIGMEMKAWLESRLLIR